jgi:phytoene synthase
MTDFELYCRDKAAPEGSNLYYSTLFETPEFRSTLFSIFALHYEITDCLTVSPDPGVTRMKLHWWSEELQRFSDRQPRHPVTRAMLSHIEPDKIWSHLKTYFEMLECLVSGIELYEVSNWKRFYFEAYGQIFLCASIMSGEKHVGDTNLILNGGALLTLEMLQSAAPLVDKAYRIVPGELLEKHHVHFSGLNDKSNKESTSKIFAILLREIKDELDIFHHYFFNTQINLPLYLYSMNRIARALCTEIQSDGNRILEHKIVLTPIRKLWITYKAKLKASLYHRV